MIPKKIIDNSDVKLSTFLNDVLKEVPNTRFDIATAFFNIQAYALIKDNIQGVKGFRLLLGKAPEIRSETTLGDVLLKMIREEVEGYELSEEKDNLVKEFIGFLNRENVEVRLYDKEFLHGKAYIFDELVVVGSSNFTPAGLTHNTELNSVSLESEARYVRTNWFDKFWNEALDFKTGLISLLEASRFGTREYTPYEVYIKSLYELQKDDIKYEDEGKEGKSSRPASKVNLSEFQEDAVRRVFSRLKKYRACMVADSVGYRQISQTISERLTMAYYRILEYKKAEKLSQEEEMALGRMIALEGIFRTILLKRLESSVDAFRKSISK